MRKVVCIAVIAAFLLLLVGCRDGGFDSIRSPEAIRGRIIGGLSGTPSVHLANEYGRARTFTDTAEMMTELRAGAIDCAIMESTTAIELVSNTSGVRILNDPLLEYDLRFAVPKENMGLLTAVNTALEALKSNGTLRGLSSKYFEGKSFTYTPPEDIEMRTGHLTIALPSDSPPFSYMDEEGRFVGMDAEVAIAVCDYLGVELRVIEQDASELINAVWFGRADLALGWRPGEEVELVNTSEHYADAVQVVIVRK